MVLESRFGNECILPGFNKENHVLYFKDHWSLPDRNLSQKTQVEGGTRSGNYGEYLDVQLEVRK